MFPNSEEQKGKLALLGMAGGFGVSKSSRQIAVRTAMRSLTNIQNVLGLVLAGVCMLASYHWFFRLMAIICFVFSIATIFILPFNARRVVPDAEIDRTPKWKRLDFIGVLLLMGALITFILALTEGPIEGWKSASFIAPFVMAFPLAIGFFVWEARIPPRSAVLPSSVWKISNIIIASLVILVPFPFWATSQLAYAQ